jgi:prophage regulatory protein
MTDICLIDKTAVCKLLGISDRTLEKLVRANRFPPPLRLGKRISWVEAVVQKWLQNAVSAQLSWEAPKRPRSR